MTAIINPLPIPKPKRSASRQKHPFLPLTISSSCSSSSSSSVWRHFTGYLVGKWIVVFHRGDAEALSNANFGKGALSKFGMAFEERDWKFIDPSDTDEGPDCLVYDLQGSRETDHLGSRVDTEEEVVEKEKEEAELEEAELEEAELEEAEQWTDQVEDDFAGKPRREFYCRNENYALFRQMRHQMSYRRYRKQVEWRKAALKSEYGGDFPISEDFIGRDESSISTRIMGEERSNDIEPPSKRARRLSGSVHTGLEEEEQQQQHQQHLFKDFRGKNESANLDLVEAGLPCDFHEDYLIYEDSDSESQDDNPKEEKPSRNLLGSCVGYPFPTKECLLLSPEEAFFLSYGLGCLTVMSSSPFATSAFSETCNASKADSLKTRQSLPFPLLELWHRLCALDPRFVPKYVGYHYYRSRGWIPRCGLKFGVDFLLYVSGPSAYHATFSVIVEEMSHDMKTVSPCRETTSAPSASGLSRVTEQVNKDLLLCHVVRPQKDSPQALRTLLSSPNCVKEFRVKEILKKRWIMDTERDQTKGLLLSM